LHELAVALGNVQKILVIMPDGKKRDTQREQTN
jgi:hypothetical protein